MRFCFVAQPYQKKYDRLYKAVLKKAIGEADFAPYRADQNPAVTQNWPEILVKIAESRIVLAEITEDNPNVWMEVGCAMALGKKIGFISPHKRKIPIDIAAEFVLFYDDLSEKSLKRLRHDITEHMQAVFEKVKRAAILAWRPTVTVGASMEKDEMIALALLSDHQDDYQRGMTAQGLCEEMNDIGPSSSRQRWKDFGIA
jgi:hypothetical protein